MSRPGPARPLARPAGFASRKVPSLRSAHFEAAVGLGGARFRAPLDLPVLIPRVKNGLPADACAQASRDRLRRLASLGPYPYGLAPLVADPFGATRRVGGYALRLGYTPLATCYASSRFALG